MKPSEESRPGKGRGGAARNGIWIVSDSVLTAVVSLGTVLVLTRMLTPRDFGLAALVTGYTLLANLYVEGLFHDALIQDRDVDDEVCACALWLVETIAGGLLALALVVVLALAASPWANVAWLTLLSVLTFPFSAYIGVGNARERRRLEYRNVALASILGRTGGCAIGIATAAAGLGAASLVLQLTGTAVLQALILAGLTGWRPRPRLAVAPVRNLLRFALPYALMHTVSGARLQVFSSLVAFYGGLGAAGLVNVALRLTATLQTALTTTLMNFGFPLLASEQGDPERLARAYALVSKVVVLTAPPAFVGLALTADAVVPLALGPGWSEVVLLVQILSLGAAAALIRLPGSFLARATGHVRYSFYNALFQLAFVAAGLLVLRPTTSLPAVLVWIAPVIVVVPVSFVVVTRLSGLGLFAQLRPILPALAGLAAMGAACLALELYAPLSPGLSLVARIVAGGLVFAATVVLLDGEVRRTLRAALKTRAG